MNSENPRIHPNDQFRDFPWKWQFRLEIENFETSRNSAYNYSIRTFDLGQNIGFLFRPARLSNHTKTRNVFQSPCRKSILYYSYLRYILRLQNCYTLVARFNSRSPIKIVMGPLTRQMTCKLIRLHDLIERIYFEYGVLTVSAVVKMENCTF